MKLNFIIVINGDFGMHYDKRKILQLSYAVLVYDNFLFNMLISFITDIKTGC